MEKMGVPHQKGPADFFRPDLVIPFYRSSLSPLFTYSFGIAQYIKIITILTCLFISTRIGCAQRELLQSPISPPLDLDLICIRL